jgi:hypothetical protein
MLAVRTLLTVSFNIDNDGAEFTFVHYIQQLMSGKPLYLNPEAYPYSAVIYTPLYLYIIYGICALCKFNYVTDILQIFIIGRMVSFLFVLLCLFYLDKFSRRWTKQLSTRLNIAAVFLILLTGHAYAMRPDSMKIAFYIAFLFYYTDYFFFSRKAGSLVLAGACALISISAKQDVLIYIFLIFGMHALYKRERRVIALCFAALIITACYFLLLRLLFGTYCLTSLFRFNFQTISNYKDSYNMYVVLLNSVRLLPLYMVLFFNAERLKHHPQYPMIRTLSYSGVIAGITTSIFLFRPGSYLNYSYELIVLTVISLIILVTYGAMLRRFKALFAVYFALLFVSGLLIKTYSYNSEKEKQYVRNFPAYDKMRNHLLPMLKSEDIIFCPDLELGIFLADKNVLYGHEYHLDRLIYAHLGLKTRSKLLLNSSENYDRYFVNGRVKYMIVTERNVAKQLIASAYPMYKLKERFNGFLLYEFSPKDV